MRAVVIYESMYGNTHQVAEAIGRGLASSGEVHVVHVTDARCRDLENCDLVVAGGPTHAHSMTRASTRHQAVVQGAGDENLTVEPDAENIGVREWLNDLAPASCCLAAAFDTRLEGSTMLTGRAAKAIAKRLHDKGYQLVSDPESFLVTKHSELVDGECDRAEEWGRSLVRHLAPSR